MQFEEINLKVLVKEERQKYIETGSSNRDNAGHSKRTKIIGVKYGNKENNRIAEWMCKMAKSYKDTKKDLRQKCNLIQSDRYSEKVSNSKTPNDGGIHG